MKVIVVGLLFFAIEAKATKLPPPDPLRQCNSDADCEVYFHGPCFRWVAVNRNNRIEHAKKLDEITKQRTCDTSRPAGKNPGAVCGVLKVGSCDRSLHRPPAMPRPEIPCAAHPYATCQIE
jgi:hypothetical protein